MNIFMQLFVLWLTHAWVYSRRLDLTPYNPLVHFQNNLNASEFSQIVLSIQLYYDGAMKVDSAV